MEGRENEMKMTEKVQCGRLKKVEDDDSDSVTEENEDDFASAVLQKRRRRCGDSMNLHELSVFATDFEFNRAIFQYGRLLFK